MSEDRPSGPPQTGEQGALPQKGGKRARRNRVPDPDRPKVLYVDDQEGNLIAFRASLRRSVEVHVTTCPNEALEMMKREEFPIVISDQRMASMLGSEFLAEVRRQWPQAIRILLTAYADFDGVVDAINEGRIDRFVRKPWDAVEMRALIHDAQRLYGSERRNREYAERLADQVKQLESAKVRAEIAEAEARRESRAKSQFLANISHEVRTPLNAVVGLVDVLLDMELDPEARHYVRLMESSSAGLLAVLNNILDLTKLDADEFCLELMDLELAELARDIGRRFAPRAHDKGLSLIVDVADGLPAMVRGDSARLRQVLSNLVDNALKFTETGEIVLRLTAKRSPHGTFEAQFQVCDTGIGIAPDLLPRLFEPFRQADSSSTRQVGGAGLGLSMAASLARAMGGRLEASSGLGIGSAFACVVPMQIVDPTPVTVAPPSGLEQLSVVVVGRASLGRQTVVRWLCRAGGDTASFDDLDAGLRYIVETGFGPRWVVLVLEDDTRTASATAEAMSRMASPGRPRCAWVAVRQAAPNGAGLPDGVVHVEEPVDAASLRRAVLDASSHVFDVAAPASPTRAAAVDTQARVLVVEDNPVNQLVARRQLEKLGCDVTVVSDGQEAVDAFEPGRFHVIFMDCQMPRMDGYEATQRIREIESGGEHTPIVALTAHALKVDRDRCFDAGMDDYVAKPAAPGALQRILEKWMMAEAG